MAVWLVRAGRRGEQEQIALDCGVVAIGWLELPDLSAFKDRESLTETYRQLHPDASPVLVGNRVGQAWAFCHRIEKGDLAVVPLKSQAAIAIGEIIGPYRYRDDLGETVKHTRPVKWVRMDIPRTAFDADLLYSLGSQLTVCRVQRNNAEARIRAVLKGGDDPGGSEEDAGETEDGDFEDLDIENAARDQLLDYIQRKFAGHKLAELVDAVLQAEGYLTRVSPPGPDGGVDILAGSGPLGFGEPRMCVQVKSSASPIDVTVLRGLQGILQNFRAEQGLLVSWGGFKQSVLQEARQSFFSIRLWDSGDLLKAIFKNYEKLPEQLQAELPLKRIWALVQEE